MYLCEHYGKHLNDVIGYSKKGKPITIEIACIRKMMKLINRKTSDYYRTVSLDALTPVSEPSYEIKDEIAQDYTLYEKIVSSLNLTENMRIALECRQNGLSYPEIGRVLSRAQATVYEYFIKMRKRYKCAKDIWQFTDNFLHTKSPTLPLLLTVQVRLILVPQGISNPNRTACS